MFVVIDAYSTSPATSVTTDNKKAYLDPSPSYLCIDYCGNKDYSYHNHDGRTCVSAASVRRHGQSERACRLESSRVSSISCCRPVLGILIDVILFNTAIKTDRLDSKLIQPASDAFKKASTEYPLATVSYNYYWRWNPDQHADPTSLPAYRKLAILHYIRDSINFPHPCVHWLRYLRWIYHPCYYPSIPCWLARPDHRISRYVGHFSR